ncbi:hypothetical protein [Aeromicrobium endophyticum]|uniref:Uncharacterized protein n=1 Tax=Aeromicrobium endophyticum TaxID=2292704 RepID=A0A371PAT6_9ACTN|nr:hypothetical protein [Aeromicrobium endophyticum]REK73039.1 hypothetical protein DX116_05480 [Aeromicrobium endophyticum]
MRTSILSRAVIAAATLAIGSVALAAAPATAATSNGITRDMVLTATSSIRADWAKNEPQSEATKASLLALASRACDLKGAEDVYGVPLQKPGNVDGLFVGARTPIGNGWDECQFAAIAPTDPSLNLTGRGTVTTSAYVGGEYTTGDVDYALSGDVFASPAVTGNSRIIRLAAEGSAVGSTKVVTTHRVPNAKTSADRKTARTMYGKRLTNAKRAYTKALKKADRTVEKKAAKSKYVARKAHAKSKYQEAVAGYKIATERSTVNVDRPFSFSFDTQLG